MVRFKFFQIRLGMYSAPQKYDNAVFRPTVVEKLADMLSVAFILSGVISAVVLASGAGWQDNYEYLTICLLRFIICLMFLTSSYAPVKYYSFAVKPTEFNWSVQFKLAVRFMRVEALIFGLGFFFYSLSLSYDWAVIANSVSFVLMLLAFIGYYIIAIIHR